MTGTNIMTVFTVEMAGPGAAIFFASFYAVDTFFWLAGFFLAYVTTDDKKLKLFKITKPLTFLVAILHRLMRLWPVYLIVILFSWGV